MQRTRSLNHFFVCCLNVFLFVFVFFSSWCRSPSYSSMSTHTLSRGCVCSFFIHLTRIKRTTCLHLCVVGAFEWFWCRHIAMHIRYTNTHSYTDSFTNMYCIEYTFLCWKCSHLMHSQGEKKTHRDCQNERIHSSINGLEDDKGLWLFFCFIHSFYIFHMLSLLLSICVIWNFLRNISPTISPNVRVSVCICCELMYTIETNSTICAVHLNRWLVLLFFFVIRCRIGLNDLVKMPTTWIVYTEKKNIWLWFIQFLWNAPSWNFSGLQQMLKHLQNS